MDRLAICAATGTMPYLGASFDDATQAALVEAADRFAANSPFEKDQTRPFHIPLIGGLHVYTRDEIYVDVGSLSEVSRSERDAFLEAAAAAFPITESSCFACRALDYVELPKKPPASRGKHRAKL